MTPVVTLPGHDCQLLYFTSSSLTADDRVLVFLAEADGCPNLHAVSLEDGVGRRLTDNHDGVLRSYVYFAGRPYAGLGKASISLDSARGIVYYLHGREIRRVDLAGRVDVLAEYPEGHVTGYTHVSADGRLLCVPTIEARALDFDGLGTPGFPRNAIDARVQAENLTSFLRIYDTRTGDEVACEPVPRGWVTHVQFSPSDPRLILYNHEWPSDCGIRRIWLWDGATHRPLRSEGSGRSRMDWTCHEMWERDGSAIVYHGILADGTAYLGRRGLNATEPVEIALPRAWTRYGHFTVGAEPGVLVSDGYFRADDHDLAPACPWISRIDADWQRERLDWRPLCRADSSWDSQDSHPHPVFDHAGDAGDAGAHVYFTSDRDGRRAIYRTPAPASMASRP
ncbi:oligogalacturonate lyase family protein [Marinivivus vitaminiproducens]|uniref:oligogalacturonate lyase family protein n=1 Tax=Marinivivus vitaminiproducens TaxID=3035935 RepID=UPI0027A929EE|nr:oligogalacturonate lyase family protein [Geminicoccaceae bacterium SCSIO 64248]